MKEPIAPQSQEQYLAWEAASPSKFELHHGFVVTFAGGTLAHDRLAFEMRKRLESLFPTPSRTFGSDIKMRVARDEYYYPDAGVFCAARFDRVEKRASYRTLPSLDAYVVVHAEARRIEIDTRALGGPRQIDVYEDGEATTLGAGSIDVTELYGFPQTT